MALTIRPQPHRLDPPVNAETLPQLITNADEMFQQLFEDLKAVNDQLALDEAAARVAGGRKTGQTAAQSNVFTYTNGTADASFIVSANVNVTTSTTHDFTVTVSYTDETTTARVLTLNFSLLDGTITADVDDANGAVPYSGFSVRIRAKAGTSITVATSGTFTTVVYNVEASLTNKES